MAAIVVALASLFVVRSSQNAAVSEVVHADDVQVGAGRSLTLLVDAETSVRGYVSTGDVQFLDTYVRAVAELPASLSTLAELVAHEPVQATRVDQIRLLATSELDTLASMREQVSLGSGQSLVELTKDGKRTMEAIRVRVSAVEAAAEQTRQDRKTHIDGLGLVAFVMTVVAGAIGSLGLVFAWVLRASAETKQRAERDRAAQALATSEEDRWHNALVLASTAEGIATIDADGLCTSMNPMGAKLLGYEPRELIGQGMHGMVHHHHADGSEYPADSCKMMLAARSGQVCRVDDEVFWCKDGTRLPVEYSAAPLLVAGVLSGAVVSFVDISERRAFDSDREQRAAELRAAIGDHQLVLYYQPKIDLKSGSVIGVEALVRWQHPHRGLVFPDDFIPLAERTGVMGHLTAFVLEEAIAQYLEWRASGLELPVAVNLSVDSLADLRFPDRLEALCKRYGVPPSALELEVTESGVMAEPLQAIKVLEILRAKGFALAIDDFGTGFSSLAYLRNLPVRQVKIDKSFVLELPHNDPDAHIVRGIIDLVHGLGKHVVAEGVETAEALAFLVGAGCETAQGYYWSRPLPAADLTVWLHEHSQRIRASVVNPFVPLG